MTTGAMLVDVLRNPKTAEKLLPQQWTDIVSLARRELVIGHLAAELQRAGIFAQLEPRLQHMLEDGLREAAHSHRLAHGEARLLATILLPIGCPVIILKGSAYVLAEFAAHAGRFAGDLDILVPRSWLGAAEIALKNAGFHILVKDAYDENYYRVWMHELPPFQHIERKSVLDVHHTILPLTGRVTPDATVLVADAVPLKYGLLRFCDADIILHSAAHLIQDGDLVGGLRNFHDLHRLLTEFSATPGFWQALASHADKHQLGRAVFYGVRGAERLFGTRVPRDFWRDMRAAKPGGLTLGMMDWLVGIRLRGLTLGRKTLSFRLAARLLYMRSHWLKMPTLMLASHLGRKAWLRVAGKKSG